jgi:hypothetical protein
MGFLRFWQPEWLDTLRSGARLILWSILVSIAGGILAVVVSQVIWQQQVQFAINAPLLIASLMSLIGSWRLTEPDHVSICARQIRPALWGGRRDCPVDLATVAAGWNLRRRCFAWQR